MDALWKGAIEDFFPEMMAFFDPDHWKEIDFSEIIFLENKLEQLTPDAESKAGRIDKLVKVQLKNGKQLWLLIHIEVQGYKDKDFAKRMFRYFYRI